MPPDATSDEFQTGLRELRALTRDAEPRVHLCLTRWQVYCLVAQLQLALRHPNNTGATRAIVEDLARDLELLFSDSRTLASLLKRGWRTEHDA